MTLLQTFLALALASTPQTEAEPVAPQPDIALETPEGSIVVTAPKSEGERRSELRKFTREVLVPARAGRPVARLSEPVCPSVQGLPAAETQHIESRIRENAKRLSIPVRLREDCMPNVHVVFMPASSGKPEKWLSYRSRALKHLLSYERQRVLNESGPVRAWSVNELRDADGRSMQVQGTFTLPTNNTRLASRLRRSVSNGIMGSVTLIELDAAQGKTLRQLADYATLRGLAGVSLTKLDGELPTGTILTLFEDADGPDQLSAYDEALLYKLYSMPRTAGDTRLLGGIAGYAAALERTSNERVDEAAD